MLNFLLGVFISLRALLLPAEVPAEQGTSTLAYTTNKTGIAASPVVLHLVKVVLRWPTLSALTPFATVIHARCAHWLAQEKEAAWFIPILETTSA